MSLLAFASNDILTLSAYQPPSNLPRASITRCWTLSVYHLSIQTIFTFQINSDRIKLKGWRFGWSVQIRLPTLYSLILGQLW